MAVMNRQLSIQEHCEAFAARRGRFVDMHKYDNSSSLLPPVASVTVSFETLDDVTDDDESGRAGAAGIEAIPPQARGVPSTIIGSASSSANPAHPSPQKAKALPGPKTYENDAHISLRLIIAER